MNRHSNIFSGSSKAHNSRNAFTSPSRVSSEESLPALLGSLEQKLFARLDRIEVSLQRLQSKPGHLVGLAADMASDADVSMPAVYNKDSYDAEDSYDIVANTQKKKEQDIDTAPVINELALRPEWLEGARPMEAVAALTNERNSRILSRELPALPVEGTHGSHWYIIIPCSRFRLCWDIVMMFIIAHDMAVVPVTLAFDTGDNFVTEVLFWPFFVFWTLDVPLSFVTGFYRQGHVVTSPRKIAFNYIASWFFMDCFLLGATIVELVSDGEGKGFLLGRVGKSLRVMRIARSLRVLRFAKLRRISESLFDRLKSDYHHIMISICKQILTIVWLNHFIACCWWAIGTNTILAGYSDSWTSHGRYEDTSLGFRYFSALHWSLTQFTPAGMEVTARNLPERIFSVFVLLFAMVSFSSFLSSITAAMTQLRQLHTNYTSNMSILQRYLRSHEVSEDLASRILNCVDHQVSKQKHLIQESQVVFLSFLSTSLKMELALNVLEPFLVTHPFFERFAEIDREAMKHVCLEAVETMLLSTDDMLFQEGSTCERMFFLTAGKLRYETSWKGRERYGQKQMTRDMSHLESKLSSLSAETSETVEFLEQSEWCCEVGLWCPWIHCGNMFADTMSDAHAVNVEAFVHITDSHKVVNRFCARYAGLFVSLLQGKAHGQSPVNDMTTLSIDKIEEIIQRAYLKRGGSSMEVGEDQMLAMGSNGDGPKMEKLAAPEARQAELAILETTDSPWETATVLSV